MIFGAEILKCPFASIIKSDKCGLNIVGNYLERGEKYGMQISDNFSAWAYGKAF